MSRKIINLKNNLLTLIVYVENKKRYTALIFYLSHQPATKSNGLSKGATEIILKIVEKIGPKVDINKSNFNHILRKNAHFFAYLVLGVLVFNGLRSIGVVRIIDTTGAVVGILGYSGFIKRRS